MISDISDVCDFSEKCNTISTHFHGGNSNIAFETLQSTFQNLSKYIIIPHFDKKPKISEYTLEKFGKSITAGEVCNASKFERMKKNGSLVPVLFSDMRVFADNPFSLNQTFLDLDKLAFGLIKECLSSKDRVFLNQSRARGVFQIDDEGTLASTGLTIICGKRSSGKSYTMDKINSNFTNVKYIRQFYLIEKNRTSAEKEFEEMISKEKTLKTQDYLADFKSIVDEVMEIDYDKQKMIFKEYHESLLAYARDNAKNDSFSKTILFQEQPYPDMTTKNITALISNVEGLLHNSVYAEIIKKHVAKAGLYNLLVELVSIYRKELRDIKVRETVNQIVIQTKKELETNSAISSIANFDLISFVKNGLIIKKFEELVEALKTSKVFYNEPILDFVIVASKNRISKPSEIQSIIKRQGEYSIAFELYSSPYKYLMKLKGLEHIPNDQIYKCFCSIDYKIKNKYGFNISGGERSEFNLQKELFDADAYDMLLIDEPESSFDNVFLKDSINARIKLLAKKMPVIIATHNNTVGVSSDPDYILYTDRVLDSENDKVEYRIYGGKMVGNELLDSEGKIVATYDVLMNCFEANETTYKKRRETYENIKN